MSTASAASQRTCLERSNGAVRSAAVTSRPQSADDATNNPACNPQHARHNAACNRRRMMQHTMRHALVTPAACPASNARQGCVGPVTHSVGGDYSTDLYPEGSESTEALFEGWAHRPWLPQADSGLLLAACAISTVSCEQRCAGQKGRLPAMRVERTASHGCRTCNTTQVRARSQSRACRRDVQRCAAEVGRKGLCGSRYACEHSRLLE
jgi:hypothetical protein